MKKTLLSVLASIGLLMSLVGCSVASSSSENLCGNLALGGSTSMEKLCEAMSESFMGEISQQDDTVKTWFDFIQSDLGKEVIQSVELIIPA